MAESREARKRGGRYCVAGGPNKVSCTNCSYTEGISMHIFPKDEIVRRKWTRFVKKHRLDFKAKSLSALCSAHFEPSCFERNTSISLGNDKPSKALRRFLIKGAVPTVDTVVPMEPKTPTSRDKRQVSGVITIFLYWESTSFSRFALPI